METFGLIIAPWNLSVNRNTCVDMSMASGLSLQGFPDLVVMLHLGLFPPHNVACQDVLQLRFYPFTHHPSHWPGLPAQCGSLPKGFRAAPTQGTLSRGLDSLFSVFLGAPSSISHPFGMPLSLGSGDLDSDLNICGAGFTHWTFYPSLILYFDFNFLFLSFIFLFLLFYIFHIFPS